MSIYPPENSVAVKSGGCFPGSATVQTEDGRTKLVRDLRVGDRVLAADDQGRAVFSDFIMFMDRGPRTRRRFVVIETAEPVRRLTLTAAHLVFVRNGSATDARFASAVRPGHHVFVSEETTWDDVRLRSARVTRVGAVDLEREGSYAPVTAHGTLVVDRVLASCYAAVEQHRWAHWALAPVRLGHALVAWMMQATGSNNNHNNKTVSYTDTEDVGLHWYARALLRVGLWFLHTDSFHPLGLADTENSVS